MKFDWIDPDRGPTPQQLDAYAVGELDDAARDAVDTWLQRHPSHAAEVEALRRLTQLWRDTPPPLPSSGTWSTVRAGIERGLYRSPKPTAPKTWIPRYSLAAVAAAVLALVMLDKGPMPAPAAEEPYPVVEAEDVVIMSIAGDDCQCLVAAQPPVCRLDDNDLAMQNDVLVLNLEPHTDGMQAEPRFEEGAPFMFTPPAGWDREP